MPIYLGQDRIGSVRLGTAFQHSYLGTVAQFAIVAMAAAFGGGSETMAAPVTTSVIATQGVAASFGGAAETMACPVSTTVIDEQAAAAFAGGAEAMAATLSATIVDEAATASFGGAAETMAATISISIVDKAGVATFAGGTEAMTAALVAYPPIGATASATTEAPEHNASVVCSVVPSGGDGSYAYQWQWSPDGASWNNSGLSGNTTASITFTESGGTVRYYRCRVTSAGLVEFSNEIGPVVWQPQPASVAAAFAGGSEAMAATILLSIVGEAVAAAFGGGAEAMTATVSTTVLDEQVAASFTGGAEAMAVSLSLTVIDEAVAASFTGGAEAMAVSLSLTVIDEAVAASFTGGAETMAATVTSGNIGPSALTFAMDGGTAAAGAAVKVAADTTVTPTVTYYPNPVPASRGVRTELSHNVGITSYVWEYRADGSSDWGIPSVAFDGSTTKDLGDSHPAWVGDEIRLTWIRNGVKENGPALSVVSNAGNYTLEMFPVPASPTVPITDQPHSFEWGNAPPSATDGYVYLPFIGLPGYAPVDFHGPRVVEWSIVTQKFGADDYYREIYFGNTFTNVEPTETAKAWIRRGMAWLDRYLDLTLTEVTDGPDVRLRIGYADTTSTGFATFPIYDDNYKQYIGINPDPGRFEQRPMAVITHEVGHILGLAHPNEGTPKRAIYVDTVMEAGAAHNDNLDTLMPSGPAHNLTWPDILGMWHITGSAPGSPAIPPDACRGFSAVSSVRGEATLTWSKPVLTGGRDITEYRVQCGGNVVFVPAGTLTHTFTGLGGGTFECYVRAANEVGMGLHSNHVDVTVVEPIVPVAFALSGGTITTGADASVQTVTAPVPVAFALSGGTITTGADAALADFAFASFGGGAETMAAPISTSVANVQSAAAFAGGSETMAAPISLTVIDEAAAASFGGGTEAMMAAVSSVALFVSASASFGGGSEAMAGQVQTISTLEPAERLATPSTVSSIVTGNSLTVSWTDVDNESGYTIEYREYDASRLDAPTPQPATAVGQGSFTANWSDVENETGYTLEYREAL